jgi:hypothetical protein
VATTNTIVAHCTAAALISEAGGETAAEAKYGPRGELLRESKWQAFKAAAKVMPKATRVATFISLWGLALDDLDRDELSVDEFAEWANESRATAFRRLAEYRELWQNEDRDVDVNEFGRRVRDHVRSDRRLRRKPSELVSIQVAI